MPAINDLGTYEGNINTAANSSFGAAPASSLPIFGAQTFTDIGGAVADLFAGLAAQTQADLKAQGLDIEAEGTEIQAQATRLQATGDIAEGTEYGLAENLANQNAAYTAASTRIAAAQEERQITQTIGGEKAATGGAGFASSGTALDLLRSSASQGALAMGALTSQGQITQLGYTEQANSYAVMKAAAETTATGENSIAGQEDKIAGQQKQLATETEEAGKQAATGDFISGVIKGVAAIATLIPA